MQGGLIFQPGQLSHSFQLRTRPDKELEGEERFRISLVLNGTLGDISPTQGDGIVIVEADQGSAGVVRIAEASAAVVAREATVEDPTAAVAVRLTRGPGTFGAVRVFWAIVPRDLTVFTAVEGSVMIRDRASNGSITITVSLEEKLRFYLKSMLPEISKRFHKITFLHLTYIFWLVTSLI